MDPLSVTASIIGILAAAAKVIEIIGPIPSTLRGAPAKQRAVSNEVKSCMNILSALQNLLLNIDSLPGQRRELIHLDHIITTFTDGVLLFSELESLVGRLSNVVANSSSRRIWWIFHDRDFDEPLHRLQWFKGSMTLLLNILQW
jgi:hypothetical protein